MQFEFEGKQWEFSHYGQPDRADVFVNKGGDIRQWNHPRQNITRLILKPVEIHHTFGGVIWKEGERQRLRPGELGLNKATREVIGAQDHELVGNYTHLIPIALA